jgi:hypothetical protein
MSCMYAYIFKNPTEFLYVFLIERVIQEEVVYVCNMHNITRHYYIACITILMHNINRSRVVSGTK